MVLGYIRRNIYSRDREILGLLSKALVRSLLEYCIKILSLMLKEDELSRKYTVFFVPGMEDQARGKPHL